MQLENRSAPTDEGKEQISERCWISLYIHVGYTEEINVLFYYTTFIVTDYLLNLLYMQNISNQFITYVYNIIMGSGKKPTLNQSYY